MSRYDVTSVVELAELAHKIAKLAQFCTIRYLSYLEFFEFPASMVRPQALNSTNQTIDWYQKFVHRLSTCSIMFAGFIVKYSKN